MLTNTSFAAQADDEYMDQLVRDKELQIADLKKAEAAMAKALEDAQADDEMMEALIAKKDTELKRLDAERKELAKQLKEARADDVGMLG
jgi:hypothetical protein